MILKLEIISFIDIVNREFSLSNDLLKSLSIWENRCRELENNQFTDFKTVTIAEMVLGSLRYLDNSIDVEKFVTRLYPNENEANQMLFSINLYPEWLQRKGVTVKGVKESKTLEMLGVKN